jgi:hypothetical protein
VCTTSQRFSLHLAQRAHVSAYLSAAGKRLLFELVRSLQLHGWTVYMFFLRASSDSRVTIFCSVVPSTKVISAPCVACSRAITIRSGNGHCWLKSLHLNVLFIDCKSCSEQEKNLVGVVPINRHQHIHLRMALRRYLARNKSTIRQSHCDNPIEGSD